MCIRDRSVAQPGSASGLGPEGRRFESCHSDHLIMKKAIIYIPNKSPMQSGLGKNNKWIIEFITNNPTTNPLMGWESSTDTYSELKLEFSTKKIKIFLNNPLPNIELLPINKIILIKLILKFFIMVGAAGFEPATLWSQTRCATRLRYAPNDCFYRLIIPFWQLKDGLYRSK